MGSDFAAIFGVRKLETYWAIVRHCLHYARRVKAIKALKVEIRE